MGAIMQDYLVMLDDLALSRNQPHEKLVAMTIHEQIKEARTKKGWSMERLAAEINAIEGKSKPLACQTIQQWENGTSAPKRTRLQTVFQVLSLSSEVEHKTKYTSTTTPAPIAAEPGKSGYASAPTPLARASLYSAVLQLGEALARADEGARLAVSSLLNTMCNSPQTADLTAKRVVALLGVEGNDHPQGFTSSPITAGR